jgi:hypothetical protein
MAPRRARIGVRPYTRAALLAALATAALVLFAGSVTPAHANVLLFCNQALVSAHGNCYGADHTLTGVQAQDDYGNDYVCAASHYNHELYASYACGYGIAEHCYGGTHLLKPLIHDPLDHDQYMHGYEFWSTGCG